MRFGKERKLILDVLSYILGDIRKWGYDYEQNSYN